MTWPQSLFFGVLQGLTEFLPISSSGHLVIVPYLLGWPDPGLVMDTLLHLGTMIAIVAYFWRDLQRLLIAGWRSLRERSLESAEARLAWSVVLGSVPAAVIGFLLEDFFERLFGIPRAAAGFLLGTAALLVLSELGGRHRWNLEHLTWRDAFLIGLAQTLAIAPGLSRSGSTIAAGLLLGYRREDATRFSFFLAVPIILGGGFYQLFKILRGGIGGVSEWGGMVLGFLAATVTGYAAIAGLLTLVRRRALWPFAVYCALLGTLVLTGVWG
ncbi:MAG: undecaprenyl-diphosphatase UppP [Anaerolineae bacterium]